MSEHPDLRPKIPLINLQKTNQGRSRLRIYLGILVLFVCSYFFVKYLHSSGYHLTFGKAKSVVAINPEVSHLSVPQEQQQEAKTEPALPTSQESTQVKTPPMGNSSPSTSNTTVTVQTPVPAALDTNAVAVASNVVQVVHMGPSDQKRVALTFDDGPHQVVTQKVLEVLRSNQVHATFFVLGNMVKKNPKILAQVVAEGNEIGNHTFSHRLLTSMTTNQVEQEFSETQNLIKNAVGFEPELFRPPYGVYRSSTKTLLLENHMKTIVLWSTDTEDWKVRDSERIFNMATNKLQNGSIILCHDIYHPTLNMLPRLIQEVKSQGYEFVTISQLCGLASTNLTRPSTYVLPPQPVLSPAVGVGSPVTQSSTTPNEPPPPSSIVVITNVVTVTNVVVPH